jgi:hypothetical protein
VIAHVGGVPVEELVPTLATVGAALVATRGWLSLRLRRRRRPSAWLGEPSTALSLRLFDGNRRGRGANMRLEKRRTAGD